ncbi:hypothetical protein PUV54_11360 [Hyphococcus flavus]|uniref:HIRAN domain-containing protein n=1 Tax=Hyphococcus flavus TaxID=1866326 RepID=A0AAF0CEQ0_9PROT|nr:HIRAN domain-containing protein [Hyphococcus flavus]WDI30554.1 hypothetical protein PUV54_11360 [Hyphococcus flavus]
MRLITKICEPSKLILAWKPVDTRKSRRHFPVGIFERQRDKILFRWLSDTEDFSLALNEGFDVLFGNDRGNSSEPQRIFDVLSKRLPRRDRPDYEKYLAQFRINPDVNISTFAMLGYTEARLASDGYSIIDTLESASKGCQYFHEVVGYHYYAKNLTGQILHSQVEFRHEPQNKYDPNAVGIFLRNQLCGYVNRLRAPMLNQILKNYTVTAYLESINGSKDKPVAHVFFELE